MEHAVLNARQVVNGPDCPPKVGLSSAIEELLSVSEDNSSLSCSLGSIVGTCLSKSESPRQGAENLRDRIMVVVERVRRSNEEIRTAIDHLVS